MDLDAIDDDALPREESLRLLAGVVVGRVVFTTRALPAVQPVSFILVDDAVVIGTGSTLTTAVRDAVVAFQADDIDPVSHAGWSVTITGCAHEVRGPGVAQRFRAHPWSQAERQHFMQIPCQLVSGLRLHPNEDYRRSLTTPTGSVAGRPTTGGWK
jgi:hypothetical protein